MVVVGMVVVVAVMVVAVMVVVAMAAVAVVVAVLVVVVAAVMVVRSAVEVAAAWLQGKGWARRGYWSRSGEIPAIFFLCNSIQRSLWKVGALLTYVDRKRGFFCFLERVKCLGMSYCDLSLPLVSCSRGFGVE